MTYTKGDIVSFMRNKQVVHAEFVEYVDQGLRARVLVKRENSITVLRVITQELV
jgi:hypothetical protein